MVKYEVSMVCRQQHHPASWKTEACHISDVYESKTQNKKVSVPLCDRCFGGKHILNKDEKPPTHWPALNIQDIKETVSGCPYCLFDLQEVMFCHYVMMSFTSLPRFILLPSGPIFMLGTIRLNILSTLNQLQLAFHGLIWVGFKM